MTSLVVYKRVKQLMEVILSNTANTTTTMYQLLNFEKKEVDVLSVNSQQPILHQSSEDNEKREAFSKIMNVAKTDKTPTTYSTAVLHRHQRCTIASAPYIIPGKESTKINKSRQSSKASSSRKQLRRL